MLLFFTIACASQLALQVFQLAFPVYSLFPQILLIIVSWLHWESARFLCLRHRFGGILVSSLRNWMQSSEHLSYALLPRVPTGMVTMNTSPSCPIITHLTFWQVLKSLDLVNELWASPLELCKLFHWISNCHHWLLPIMAGSHSCKSLLSTRGCCNTGFHSSTSTATAAAFCYISYMGFFLKGAKGR